MHCKEALHYNEEEEEEAEKEEGGGAEGGIALQDGTWPTTSTITTISRSTASLSEGSATTIV